MQVLVFGAVALASAAAVALVGVALGGGGSSSRDEYEATVVDARNEVEFALSQISEAQSLELLLSRLDEAALVLDRIATDLDQAAVADGFEEEHDELVAALGALSSEVSGTAATMRDPNFAAALPNLTSLSFKQWNVVNRVLGDLKKRGIDVEPLGRH